MCQLGLEALLDFLCISGNKLVLLGKGFEGPKRGIVVAGKGVKFGDEPVAQLGRCLRGEHGLAQRQRLFSAMADREASAGRWLTAIVESAIGLGSDSRFRGR